jgi:hypothetical protein
MSNIDKMTAKFELDDLGNKKELFTKLTLEEGAVIVGGATFKLLGVDAVKAGKQYDIYVNFNGTRMFGTKTLYSGNYYDETNNPVSFETAGRLSIWDEDNSSWPWGDDDDDLLGSWRISDTPGRYWARVWGDGYDYTLDYEIT